MKHIFGFIHQKGQSLFELIIAIGISAMIIIVLVTLVNNALQSAAFSKNQTLAARYAQEATEWLRAQRDNNVATFLSNATSVPLSWCLKDSTLNGSASWNQHSSCSATDTISGTNLFTRQVDFTHYPNYNATGKTVIEAAVVVTWIDSKGTHKVKSTTQFTDWRQR